MMEQTQKMKIDPTKPWPFRWVDGTDTAEKCKLKLTKERKCKQLDTFEDCEEALF